MYRRWGHGVYMGEVQGLKVKGGRVAGGRLSGPVFWVIPYPSISPAALRVTGNPAPAGRAVFQLIFGCIGKQVPAKRETVAVVSDKPAGEGRCVEKYG